MKKLPNWAIGARRHRDRAGHREKTGEMEQKAIVAQTAVMALLAETGHVVNRVDRAPKVYQVAMDSLGWTGLRVCVMSNATGLSCF